ncbi:proline--tRNA ligase [Candidatus Poriferisodalis sp.]|uniref:proline--tRNA ligase n=1 Tax=Candidatus Poriferisodalis sp. TaxID=3101277 RepID=UPI003D12A083
MHRMRWSDSFIPTLREPPADAEAASHRLLVRAGFVRQLHSGHYSLLPLGLRVHRRVADIVRAEMDAIGAQEFLLPAMHPAALWQRSGRWDVMGAEMFRLRDRNDVDIVLGMTHEEVFALLAAEMSSYRELPQTWYQIQTKFRDEPRPKSGLLRVREFAMKDSYSFDIDEAGLDASFEIHREAYVRIFGRLGLDAMAVEASSGAMGGSASVEFMVASPAGEDDVARCGACGYRANVERARAAVPPIDDPPSGSAPERFPTPGVRTIAQLSDFDGGARAGRQIKTMVMVLDDEVTLVALRGDHQLNLQKLADHTGATDIRPASAAETVAELGANPGSLGAVGVDHLPVYADEALRGRRSMTTGANSDDWHYRGVDVGRDLIDPRWADLRGVSAGEACIECGGTLEIVRCIEAGHIFKLGRRYAEAMGVSVLDADGIARTPIMGSYGIGIGRAMAAVAETHYDDRGLCWPVGVAPFDVVVTVLDPADPAQSSASEVLYSELQRRNIDCLYDDRVLRPGVKLADAELVGIPYRVTVGARSLAQGNLELTERSTGETQMIEVGEAPELVVAVVTAASL